MRVVTLILLFTILTSCSDKSSTTREYTEIRSGVKKFGQLATGGMSASNNGVITQEEKQLLVESKNANNLSEGLSWKLPKGWSEQEDSSKVRLATINNLDGKEITLVNFPGDVGGIKANVSRWLRQVEITLLPPELDKLVASLDISINPQKLKYFLVNLEDFEVIKSINHQETILVGIFFFQDQTLFVKIQGSLELIKKEEQSFKYFVESIGIK